jgi:hypothetical protein
MKPGQSDPRIAADAVAGAPAPLLECIEEQLIGAADPDSASDQRARAFLETRMRQHISRHGGST